MIAQKTFVTKSITGKDKLLRMELILGRLRGRNISKHRTQIQREVRRADPGNTTHK